MTARHLFTSLLGACCAAAAMAGPVIKWDSTCHDFGAFNEDLSTVTCTFRGINTGDDTLVLYNVTTNCGCTTTGRYAGREYKPGDSIVIDVTYNAVGRPGRFSKKVLVHSNAEPTKQTLTVSGTVMAAANTLKSRYPVDAGPMKLHSSTALLGEVNKGGAAGAYFKCYNPGPGVLRPKVVSKPDYIDVVIKPTVVSAGEQFVISVSFFSAKCPQWGIVTDTIVIRPNTGSDQLIRLTTVTTVKEDFSRYTQEQMDLAPKLAIEPTLIDLGRISRADGPVTRKLTISNSGRNPLMVRRVYSPDTALSISCPVTKIAHSRSAEVSVTANPAAVDGSDIINARITLITNDPRQPVKIVRVVGEIVK